MTTDDQKLTEQIRRARTVPAEWAQLGEGESTCEQIARHQARIDEQTAALIRKAQADAWGEGAQAQADTHGGQIDTGPNPYEEQTNG